MAVMIYPKALLHPDDIDTDISIRGGYYSRYSRALPPEPGDIPAVVKSRTLGPFPHAMAYGFFWVVSKAFLEVVRRTNGPQWPVRASEIKFIDDTGGEFPVMFLEYVPRFHRFNHDDRTYPVVRPEAMIEGVKWSRELAPHPANRTVRPSRPGDPSFWEEAGTVVGDVWWGGDLKQHVCHKPVVESYSTGVS